MWYGCMACSEGWAISTVANQVNTQYICSVDQAILTSDIMSPKIIEI